MDLGANIGPIGYPQVLNIGAPENLLERCDIMSDNSIYDAKLLRFLGNRRPTTWKKLVRNH